MIPARFWQPAENGAVQCQLCPHRCRIPDGTRSRCYGRVNRGGTLLAETWGWPVAMSVDPMEKKPLNHFLPGRPVLSLGTLGCNLSCRFCQNWDLSHPDRGAVPPSKVVRPEEIAHTAVRRGIVVARSVVDALVELCHAAGVNPVDLVAGVAPGSAGAEAPKATQGE